MTLMLLLFESMKPLLGKFLEQYRLFVCYFYDEVVQFSALLLAVEGTLKTCHKEAWKFHVFSLLKHV